MEYLRILIPAKQGWLGRKVMIKINIIWLTDPLYVCRKVVVDWVCGAISDELTLANQVSLEVREY